MFTELFQTIRPDSHISKKNQVILALLSWRSQYSHLPHHHGIGPIQLLKCCIKIKKNDTSFECTQIRDQIYRCLFDIKYGFDLLKLYREVESNISDNVKNMCIEREQIGPIRIATGSSSLRSSPIPTPYSVKRPNNVVKAPIWTPPESRISILDEPVHLQIGDITQNLHSVKTQEISKPQSVNPMPQLPLSTYQIEVEETPLDLSTGNRVWKR